MENRVFSRGLWVISILFYCIAETVIAGTIVGWGLNNDGETTPPEGTDFTVIAAGLNHCLALKTDGSIVGWGENANGEATPPAGTDYLAIAAGYEHSLALRVDGSIVGWGNEGDDRWAIPEGNDFVAIADGSFHCLAVKSDGIVVGWGFDLMGQSTPPDGNDFVAVAAGNYHSLALRSDGSVVCWGHDSEGQGTSPDGNDFVAIDAGRNHNVALKKDGSIFCWGSDSDGQASPPDGNDFVAVAAGMWHSLALKKDGSIVCWGRDEYGERTPPKGSDFLAVDGGYYYSVAIRRYGGGSGEPNDPYLIYDANQMQAIGVDANDWDKCFLLMADIDLSDFTGTEFNIIGSSSKPFTGVFDGAGHTISNFTYDSIHRRELGLFGVVAGTGAVIKNVGLINADVCARHTMMHLSVGSLIGRLEDGTVENCYANGGSVRGFALSGNFAYVGGLVGFCSSGEITRCYAAGNAGGYALQSCLADVGGLVGRLIINSRINDSYATGSVFGIALQTSSYAYIGGLVGRFYLGSEIMNSYAAGKVEAITDGVADANTGGFAGYRAHPITLATNSFWDTETSGQINGVGSGDPNGVYGRTTAEMMQQATFDPPWDFVGNWGIIENETYPLLRAINFCAQTSYPTADVNKDCRIDFYDIAITALSWLQDKNW